MKKIIVIGPAGAGKSTLAAALAVKLGVPHHELDAINHQPDWQPIDKDEFRRRVAELTKTDGWVFCGNYVSTLGFDFWRQADTIIWCDFSFPLVLRRLVTRTLSRGIRRQELWNGNRESLYKNFLTNDSVIRWMMTTWNKQKQRYTPIFSGDGAAFPGVTSVWLKRPKDAHAYLQAVTSE